MTTSDIPSSVFNIRDAVAGFSTYFFYCVEPGAFQCTSNVVALLRAEEKQVHWVGGGWFLDQKPVDENIMSLSSFYQKSTVYPSHDVCVVLGSQAGYGTTQECIDFCRQQGYFSFFLFDHWCNLDLHFLEQANQTLHLPNRIGVVDEFEKKILWDVLLPYNPPQDYSGNIVVVGQPSIESMVQKINRISEEEIQSFRNTVCSDGQLLQVYFMEPNCQDFHLELWDTSYLGYTEFTVMDMILKNERQKNDVLIIKPHPRQDMEVLNKVLADYTEDVMQNCIVVTDTPLELILASADRILGMTSVVLIMALKAGKTVVSFQPNRTARGEKMSNLYIERYRKL